MRNLKHLLPLAALSLLGAQCTHVIIDRSMAASQANDPTIVFQGGGAVSQKGYLFLQKREGTNPADPLALIVPSVKCQRDDCIRFQFFRKDGSPGFSGAVPKGTTRFNFELSDLLGHTDEVTQADNGEYSGIVQIYYLGNDGTEYTTFLNGFIRLNILMKAYEGLACNDPAVTWKIKTGKSCHVQFTTAGRSVTCGDGCHL